jgi:hypothetical protein
MSNAPIPPKPRALLHVGRARPRPRRVAAPPDSRGPAFGELTRGNIRIRCDSTTAAFPDLVCVGTRNAGIGTNYYRF